MYRDKSGTISPPLLIGRYAGYVPGCTGMYRHRQKQRCFMRTKVCIKCGIEKPTVKFKKLKTGRGKTCNSCVYAREKEFATMTMEERREARFEASVNRYENWKRISAARARK